jgi:hypothetical protein
MAMKAECCSLLVLAVEGGRCTEQVDGKAGWVGLFIHSRTTQKRAPHRKRSKHSSSHPHSKNYHIPSHTNPLSILLLTPKLPILTYNFTYIQDEVAHAR